MKKQIFLGKKTAVILLLLALPASVFISCIESPLEPVGPSYEIQLGIPVMDRTWETKDFQNGSNWQDNGDGTFSYINTYAIDKKSLDSIAAYPKPDSDKTTLGNFMISPFTTPALVYNALELGFNVGQPPQIIPPGSSIIDANVYDNTQQFDFVAVDTGSLRISVTNNLPIPIDFPEQIVIRNNWNYPGNVNNDQVATFIINDTLAPGESLEAGLPLSGRLIYGLLTTDQFHIHTPGSDSAVSFSSSDNISFTFHSTTISADSAYAVIPSQNITAEKDSRFIFDDSLTLKKATFKSGMIKVEIDNHVDLYTETYLSINELYNGVSTTDNFNKTFTFTEAGALDTVLSISDYTISTNKDTIGTMMHYSAYIKIIDSHRMKKHVTKNDFIQAKISASDSLYARYIKGNFPTQYKDVNSGTKAEYNLDDLNKSGYDSLVFKGFNAKIRIQLSVGSNPPPVDYYNLVIVSKNSKWNQVDLITLGDGHLFPTPGETTIDLPEAQRDEFLNSLIRHYPDLPDSLFVRGYFVINPDFKNHPESSYEIQDTSAIYPYVDIEVPSFVKISGAYVREVKDINEIIPDDVARSVINGTLNLAFTNGIPVQMTASVGFFGTDSTEMDTLLFGPLGPVAAAHVNPADSTADAASPTNIGIGLTGDQVMKISRSDSVFVRLDINSGSGAGTMVRLRNTDAVRVRASTKLRYVINKP